MVGRRGRFVTQRGLSFSNLMLGIALAAFFGTLLLKMGPAYFKFWQVRSAMEKMHEQPQLIAQGGRAVLDAINRQLYIDEVRDFDTNAFSVKQAREGRGLEVSVEYQEQMPMFANIDVVMHFAHTVVLTPP